VDGLFDTHCHLNLNIFEEDLTLVMERGREAGVSFFLVPGIDVATSRRAVELAEQFPGVYAAVGIHPSEAYQWNPQVAREISSLARHPHVVAIGEIGLDYYRDRTPRELQQAILREQLGLALDVQLPVILHQRASFDDLWNMLNQWLQENRGDAPYLTDRAGVFHSFDGTAEEARKVTELGFLVGVSGPVTYKNALNRRAIVSCLDLSSIVLETDSPYLPPHPFRGKRNEPAFLRYVSEKVAEIHQINSVEIAGITTHNAARLFALELLS